MPQNDSKQAELKVIKFKKFFLLQFQVRSPAKDLNNEQSRSLPKYLKELVCLLIFPASVDSKCYSIFSNSTIVICNSRISNRWSVVAYYFVCTCVNCYHSSV